MKRKHFSRFSNASQYYNAGRPKYPKKLLNVALEKIPKDSLVIDVGSGTGISTRLLLDIGYEVIAVEPNKAMIDSSVITKNDALIINNTWDKVNITEDRKLSAVFFFMSFHYLDPEKSLKKAKLLLGNEKIISIINYYLSQEESNSKKYHNWLTSLDKRTNKKQVPLIQNTVLKDVKKYTRAREIEKTTISQELTVSELTERSLSLPHVINQQYSKDWLVAELKKLFSLKSMEDTISLAYEMRCITINTSDVSFTC